jgi:antitoxin component of RelBE/YafQ-DinJ toxin-antitoxin module
MNTAKLKTKSYYIDSDTDEAVRAKAQEYSISQSDALRMMVKQADTQGLFLKARLLASKYAQELGINTEEDVEKIFG